MPRCLSSATAPSAGPLPALGGFVDAEDLLARAERREATCHWLRAKLVEDPVLYREELTEAEWLELRRRLGEEERYLDEMFGLVLEARAEGVSARPFPAGGTVGHAALLLIDRMRGGAPEGPARWWSAAEVAAQVVELASEHATHWAGGLVAAPDRLARMAVDLLVEVRLAERRQRDGLVEVRLPPAAGRFAPAEPTGRDSAQTTIQDTLW